jgi:hypothetical protein
VQFIEEITAAVDVWWIRASAGGEKLSAEMVLILALVTFDGYELFPGNRRRDGDLESRSVRA